MEYLKSGGLSLMDKLNILTDSAKYDVACTSSGSERKGSGRGMGNTIAGGDLSQFCRRRKVYFASENTIYKLLCIRL